MNSSTFRCLALSPRAKGASTQGWFEIPIKTWESMLEDVRQYFSDEAIYLFLEALYFEVGVASDAFSRPPKGTTLKHLGLWVLHLIITGGSFDSYTPEGGLSLGLSKSYLRPTLDYILAQTERFVETHLRPRPIAEMKELAKEFYSQLGSTNQPFIFKC